jgi:hypothetical protein
MTSDTLLPFMNDPLWGVLLRLAINAVILYVLIFLIYSRFSKKKDFMFPLFLMGTILFLICILLKKSEMQMGMALGLFAVFSIMRFRTENLVSKNMAYLFTVTGISVINAMFDFPHPVRGTILINLIIIVAVLLLELSFKKFAVAIEIEDKEKADKKARKKEGKTDKDKTFISSRLLYDNLPMLNPDKMDDLKTDLTRRTGIAIDKVKIRRIDLINNNADLEIFYKDKSAGND